jgi:putative transposase
MRSVLRTPVWVFAVRLHQTGCSLRETITTFAELGVKRSNGAVRNWVCQVVDRARDPPKAEPKRVAVDETAVKIHGKWSWVYDAIDAITKLILDAKLFGRRGTDPAAAFLHGRREKHDLSETVFLVE